MKNRIILIIIFIHLILFSSFGQQKLNGRYEYYFGDASGSFGTEIDFLPNQTFSYYDFQCMSHQIGKGNYKIGNNTLILKFTRPDTLENMIKTINTSPMNNVVTYNLSIKHIDKPKDGLQESEPVFVEIKYGIKDSLIMEATDSNGNYQLKLPSSNTTITLEIGDKTYYKSAKIITTLKEGFNSEVLLAPYCYECTDVKELTYKVLEIKKDRLTLLKNGKKFVFKKSKIE